MENSINLEILTKTLDDMPVGVGIFQVEDLTDIKSIRYVFMNKVILYEMRKEREDVFGKKIIEVAPEAYEHEGGRLVMETYRKIASEGGSVNLGLVEYSNHMVAGTYECSVHHIKDNFVYVMLRNVTELEQTKNELEQKNNELSQFAHLVSHDLKAPLNSISSLIELIKDEYQGHFDSSLKELFGNISGATMRMKSLITDLLDLSGLGKGKKLTQVDCQKLVEVVQQDLAATIKESGAQIEVGELPQVQGYETELRLLFQNLINNAIKFSKTNVQPQITITAEKQDNWTFYIQDNGIGIANEHKDKIFDAFERLHSSSEYEGTGIGLAHCKKIIDLHNGEIGVTSAVGEGSSFYFTLPNNP
jgi:light-regulated signal transduction histidine kinase (bacteriophytochrome)